MHSQRLDKVEDFYSQAARSELIFIELFSCMKIMIVFFSQSDRFVEIVGNSDMTTEDGETALILALIEGKST